MNSRNPLDINQTEIQQAVDDADEWMAEHRVTEAWRMISRLRDTIVRMQSTQNSKENNA